jgi:hypothetical protein
VTGRPARVRFRVWARIRGRVGEIRPAAAAAPVRRRSVYAWGLGGVAILIALAWVNNARQVAVASLVALVLGVIFVTFMAHRSVVTTTIAIVWWIGTAPAVGVFSTAGLPESDVYFVMSQATTTNVGLGVVVWLAAGLARAPRPATTIVACWLLNFVVVVAASFITPAHAWLVGYAVTVLALAQRTGLLARLRAGRTRRGAAGPDDPAQAAARQALNELPSSHAIRCTAADGEAEPGLTMVVGPTGTFAVVGLLTDDPVRAVSGGSRLSAGTRRLDRDIRAAARAAVRVAASLRTPVSPVLVVAGGEFPDGLARMAVRPVSRAEPVEVLVLRADLAAGRLGHGSTVLTAGQVSRILRRIDVLASSTKD